MAENLTGEITEEVVLRKGLLTKSKSKDIYGQYVYYLDGQRLTNDEYMQIINNCPESKYYYEKGCKQRKTGRILLITGGGCVVLGAALLLIEDDIIGPAVIAGVTSSLVSIPFFISGKHKKENAYQVYNEYCATKPTATLSFGPATKGIGMGVYLNF